MLKGLLDRQIRRRNTLVFEKQVTFWFPIHHALGRLYPNIGQAQAIGLHGLGGQGKNLLIRDEPGF
jgi:putative protein kinase ArgK-like GTPase of G3E family